MSNVELGVQTEKAFQKQPIFQNSKAALKTRDRRWYKDVGLGFKTPRAAIDGTYIGKHFDTISSTISTQSISNSTSRIPKVQSIAASALVNCSKCSSNKCINIVHWRMHHDESASSTHMETA